jgi:hypothetical protein
MSFCNIEIPTIGTIMAVDTRFQSNKVIQFPAASSVPGRFITIKDLYGTAGNSSFTLSTTGVDLFNGFVPAIRVVSSFAALNLVSDGLQSWRLSGWTSGEYVGTTFSPSSISSLALWLDASDPWNQGSNSTLTQTILPIWYDKSGGERNGILSTSLTRFPSTIVNYFTSPNYLASLPQISNVAQSYNWNMDLFSTNTGTTLFLLGHWTSGAGSPVFQHGSVDGAVSYLRTVFRDTNNRVNIGFGGNSGTFNTAPAAPAITVPWLTTVVWDTIPNITWYNYNGANVGPPFRWNLSTTTVLPIVSPRFRINTTGNSGILEFLYYNEPLPSTTVSQIEGYLMWKWGQQGNLATAHPYKNFPPM